MPVAAGISSFAAGLLAAVLLVTAIAGSHSRVEAAGDAIRVVETQQQVNYPSGVGLSVTVESEHEIAEVRVYYRAAGSGRWGYAYADFDPGTRVVATRSIPVREATYLAPGVDVEYFYEIRDVQGNVFKTDRAIVEFLDPRFEWRRVKVGPLQLVYHDIDESRVEDAARALSEDLRRVEEVLGLEQAEGFKGVIYNSYADANAAFPMQSQTTTDHGTFAGYAFPEQGVFVGQGLDRRIIVHESSHMMMHDAVGHDVVELPSWLSEGFSTYMEPNVRVMSSRELYGRTPPLRAMKSLTGTPEAIRLFYRKSVSVVAHLVEVYGEDNFRRLLDEIRAGRTIETALINVYGFDDDGLDASWAGLPIPQPPRAVQNPAPPPRPEPTEALVESESGPNSVANQERQSEVATPADRSAPSTPALPERRQEQSPLAQSTPAPPAPPTKQREGPSPFVFIDVWVLAGVAFLAVSVLTARFIYNRLRRTIDPSYGNWQEWDEPDQP